MTKLLLKLVLAGVVMASLAGPVAALASSPYAVQIVSALGPFGPSPYNDTNSVLNGPTTRFFDPFGPLSGGITNPRVKVVEAAFNMTADTNNPASPDVVLTLSGGSSIIVKFDHPVYDDPANPYGIDLLVFGNSFYDSTGPVNDLVDMSSIILTGGGAYEPMKVSVSPGYTGQPGQDPNDPSTWPWYRYDNGPYDDTPFPTEGFKWNRATTNWSSEVMDFTKPVNPMLGDRLNAGGLSAADAIDYYTGSGGGTGFDLKQSGFAWIQYVKVEGIDPDFSDGEVDAFLIVRPMMVGDSLAIAPENPTNGTGTLIFEKPGTNQNLVTVSFTAVNAVARMDTAVLNDPTTLGPLTGTPLTSVQLGLSPILGTNTVTFQATVSLATGGSYGGNGSDLLVFKWTGTNWSSQPFTFVATNQTVFLTGVTNLSALTVTQITPPRLSIQKVAGGYAFQFLPLVGFTHTLERSANFVGWMGLTSVTATNALPVVLVDTNAPGDKAFYRLRLNGP